MNPVDEVISAVVGHDCPMRDMRPIWDVRHLAVGWQCRCGFERLLRMSQVRFYGNSSELMKAVGADGMIPRVANMVGILLLLGEEEV